MQYFLWIVIFILINLFYFLLYLYMNKRILHGEISTLKEKINQLEEALDNADQMINELNNISDYVTTRMEKENANLLKTMGGLEEKMKRASELKAVINDQIDQYGNLIEQYKQEIKKCLEEKSTIKAEDDISKKLSSHPKYNEVIKLSEEGKSIKDIARELHIGQGEVKLLLGIKK